MMNEDEDYQWESLLPYWVEEERDILNTTLYRNHSPHPDL